MEMQNLQSAKKLAVNQFSMKFLIFLLGFLFSGDLQSQILSGKYLCQFPEGIGYTLEFSGINFNSSVGGDLGNTIGRGTYKIVSNTLTLNYGHSINKDSSICKIFKESKITKPLQIKIMVYDGSNKNLPFHDAFCLIKDNSYRTIKSINTDQNGKAIFFLKEDLKTIKSLLITYIGYDPVNIPFKINKDRGLDIKIFLKPIKQYYRNDTIEEFTFKKKTTDTLILKSSSGQLLNFRKVIDSSKK